MKNKSSYIIGVQAEKNVENDLRQHGYVILYKRYKTKYGEVDIIASKGSILACVEVKSRRNKVWDNLVSFVQQKRIVNSVKIFLADNPQYANFQIRFDVGLIIHEEFNYIENAFFACD